MPEMLPSQVKVGESVLYHAVSGDLVLLNMTSQEYFGLDDIGRRMWELLVEFGSLAKVEERLAAEFEVDTASLRGDLEGLVGKLLNAGLLQAA